MIDSATTLVGGISQMITDAVAKSVAGGASAADLTPLTELATTLGVKSSALAAAVAANTPAPAPTPAQAARIKASVAAK